MNIVKHRDPPKLGLEFELVGHQGPVLTAQFDSNGTRIASGGVDRNILLWHLPIANTVNEANYGVIKGHKGAVTCVQWNDDHLLSASSDATVGYWDAETGTRLRNWKHNDTVNQVTALGAGAASVSDDGRLLVWDSREKQSVASVASDFPLLTVATNSAQTTVWTAGVDGSVRAYDTRNFDKELWNCADLGDTITSLSVNFDGLMLLARLLNGTLRILNPRDTLPTGMSRLTSSIFNGSAPKSPWGCRACFSPTGLEVISGGNGGVVFDVTLARMMKQFHEEDIVIDVGVTEKNLVTATNKGLYVMPV